MTGPDRASPHPEADHTKGLEELSHAVRYRRYVFDLLAPHCGNAILEIGAGQGEFAAHFEAEHQIIVSDTDPECLGALARRFAGHEHVVVATLDVDHEVRLEQPVDTVVAINVLEHIPDDAGALRNMAAALRPGGNVVLYVPAFMALYGAFDRAVGHVRRYTPATMRAAVEQAGLSPVELRVVNFLGGISWWLAVRLGGQIHPKPWLVKLYDLLVIPIVRVMDRWVRLPFGKSIVCVARKS